MNLALSVYHAAVLGALAILFLTLLSNLVAIRRLSPRSRLKPGTGPEHFPFVSILVPARNEERGLRPCLESLLKQQYPEFEVLVCDDGSEDATAEILAEMARGNARLKPFRSQDLPPGWLGKCFACHQLAERARGELLLFTDADTVHHPGALASAVAELQASGAGLLSLVTRLEMRTFAEKIILPLVPFTALAYLPFFLIRRLRNPLFAIGNGQFMLFRRPAYDAAGGHAAVREALVEDVWLARRVKASGFPLALCDGGKLVSCRMYRSSREIWEGFSKNIFAGFNFSLIPLAAVCSFSLAAFILPYFFLLAGVLLPLDSSRWIHEPAAEIVLALAMRLMLAARYRLGVISALLHSLGMACFLAIAVNSALRILTGRGARWKGRTYHPR
jgi:chlorobactene glucosyltransferase